MSVFKTFDVCCPRCGGDDQIDVTAMLDVRLTKHGSDCDASRNGDHAWDNDSPCSCQCGWSGVFSDMEISQEQRTKIFRDAAEEEGWNFANPKPGVVSPIVHADFDEMYDDWQECCDDQFIQPNAFVPAPTVETITNDQRADIVSGLISDFSCTVGNQDEDPEVMVGDMVCNLLHWVARQPREEVSFPDRDGTIAALCAWKFGLGHFLSEHFASEGDEIGPDFFIDGSAYGEDYNNKKINRVIRATIHRGAAAPEVHILNYQD